MTKQLTLQEQEALSAYLDNALNPRERQRLETQLQSRPDMRAALNELRQTQVLLRQTPVLRVPRNFTLSPEMAGLRTRPPRAYPIFQWAFTLASLFFVLIFAGELFSGSPAANSTIAMAPAAETFGLEEAPAEAMDTGPAMGENADAQRNTATEDGEAGSTELLPPSEGTPTPEMSFAIAETFTPTAEPTFKSAPETETVEEIIPAAEEPMTYSTMPEADTGLAQTAPEVQPQPQPGFGTSPLRVLQVILGAVVLLSGVGLVFVRRKTML